MIYRFFKKIHAFTAFIGILCFYLSASVSDFSVEIERTPEPSSAETYITWGVILMLPTVIYLILNYAKEKYLNIR